MSSNSRFSRNGIESSLSIEDDNKTELFEKLKKRLNVLKSKRMRYEIDLDNAKKEIKKCEEEAKKIKVSSLEEMEHYVKQLKDKEEKELNEFITYLKNEEDLLDNIELKLKNMESE